MKRTFNSDEYSDWDAWYLEQLYFLEHGYGEDDEAGEEVEPDINPDLYDQYEYMLDHQDEV